MSDDSEEEVMESNYELGQVVQVESLEREFRNDAARSFAYNHDEQARWERRWADELKKRAKKMREDYNKKWAGCENARAVGVE